MRAPSSPPPGRTAVIFVTFGIILAPFRDKIAATSDQMLFWAENALKCVCGRGSAQTPLGELTALPTCLLLTHVALCQRVRGVIARTRYINAVRLITASDHIGPHRTSGHKKCV